MQESRALSHLQGSQDLSLLHHTTSQCFQLEILTLKGWENFKIQKLLVADMGKQHSLCITNFLSLHLSFLIFKITFVVPLTGEPSSSLGPTTCLPMLEL